MTCVATSFGSAGDFLPTLAIAAAIRRRGHAVRFVANPSYAHYARRAGVDFVPAGHDVDVLAQIEQDPGYADTGNAAKLLQDFIVPDVAATYDVVRKLLRSDRADVVVASNVSFGALWAAAEQGVPSALVHASPVMWMSRQAPLVLGDAVPPVLYRPLTPVLRSVMHWYVGRVLRPLARRLGSSVGDPSFVGSTRSAALELGLWSPRLRAVLAGEPANRAVCGFAHASGLGAPDGVLPPDVDAFLSAGTPPIVAGLGSAFSRIAGPLLVDLAHACGELGRRCLVIGHPAGAVFPPNTFATAYAPYDRVFPRAAAVVVHGGAGTTGEALRAGRPILAVPFAYDQFTLSTDVERLGVGRRVREKRRSRADLVVTLREVLDDEVIATRAAESGAQFAAERDGAETAADAIERLATGRATG